MTGPVPDPAGGATGRISIATTAEELPDAFGRFAHDGYRLALVAAHHDPEMPGQDATMRLVYLLVAGPPDRRVELRVSVPAAAARVPSLAALSLPASRFEREVRDLFGVDFVGHPQPGPLVLHQHWPADWHPMRADAGPPPAFGDESTPYQFLTVEGAGVYEIPVGPVHAGLIEPGHFRFAVVGETIVRMRARLWFLHKGVERLFQGRDVDSGVELAERISGDTSVGHALAYCLAVEEACGCSVPHTAQVARAVLLELERVYNHVADIGALCNDVAFGVANAHALRIRERLLRLNADVTGHRLLRGAIRPGGTTLRSFPSATTLQEIQRDINDVVAFALARSTVVDRFSGTAVLGTEQAAEIGTLGYVARASGLGDDARVAHPFADLYGDLEVPVLDTGDVLARFSIRVAEIDASISLLSRLLADEPGVIESRVPVSAPTERSDGVGLVEGWRGTIAHRAEIGPDGTLERVKVVDPSFFNWPALHIALADTIVPDFPLANKSFNQSYAGNDL